MTIKTTYTAHPDSVIIESGPLDDVLLQSIVDLWDQLESERLAAVSCLDPRMEGSGTHLQDCRSRNTVRK